jgi:hypothetical protein
MGRGWQDTEIHLVVSDVVLTQPPSEQLLWISMEHDHLHNSLMVLLLLFGMLTTQAFLC